MVRVGGLSRLGWPGLVGRVGPVGPVRNLLRPKTLPAQACHASLPPAQSRISHGRGVARYEPLVVISGPMVRVEMERVEALELMGMVVAHLNHAEATGDLSPRIATLMSIRDKLAVGLWEEQ